MSLWAALSYVSQRDRGGARSGEDIQQLRTDDAGAGGRQDKSASSVASNKENN